MLKVLAAALQPLGSASAHCSRGGAQWLLTSRQYSIALWRQKPMNSSTTTHHVCCYYVSIQTWAFWIAVQLLRKHACPQGSRLQSVP